MKRKIKTTGDLLQALDFRKNRNWIQDFYDFETPLLAKALVTEGENYWQRVGETRVLRLFHAMVARVPAYRDFLKKNGVRSAKVQTIADYKSLPTLSKKTYVQKYALEDRCWDGELSEDSLIAVSSGTTGEPTFWPRGEYQSFEQSVVHELLYREWFNLAERKTLLIIAFPMGMYVSGIATTIPSWLVACKKYPVSIVSVGPQKNEIYKIAKLYDRYDQTVIIGHPFFVKDVIESGVKQSIPWSKMNLKMMFCSEGFNEDWRKHVSNLAGINSSQNALFNTYGSSEMLLMSYETELSVKIRQLASESKKVLQHLFSPDKQVPNFFQFNPFLRYVESVDDELTLSCASGVPLVRYRTNDRGKVHTFNDVINACQENLSKTEWQKLNTLASKSWNLPFMSLSGRADSSIVYYAANIYPEHIRPAVETPALFKKITGKLLMRVTENKHHDQVLNIDVELCEKVKPSNALRRNIEKKIYNTLRALNSEYAFIDVHIHRDTKPKVHLRQNRDPKFFPPGKPKWIQR